MSRKPLKSPPPPRRVWRITESAPMGVWVDPDQPPSPPATLPGDASDVTPSGWMVSSFDLQRGADVRDDPDTIPPELYDELFPPQATQGSDEGSAGH